MATQSSSPWLGYMPWGAIGGQKFPVRVRASLAAGRTAVHRPVEQRGTVESQRGVGTGEVDP